MRILIVDDDPGKQDAIRTLIVAASLESDRLQVEVVGSLSEAVALCSRLLYDLIVLDLLLPYLPRGQVDHRAGLELLRVIRRSNELNSHTPVIGLSAHPDEIEISRFSFEGQGVLLLRYDEEQTWKIAVEKVVTGIASRTVKISVDFVIVVALLEERAGLESAGFIFKADAIVNGLNVKYADVEVEGSLKSGAIILLRQMGLVVSTLEATQILSTFSCSVVCMSGICAGFSKRTQLGQVLIASPAWEYQAGKWSTDGFLIAPSQIPLRSRTRVQLEKICQQRDVVDFLEDGLPRAFRRPSSVCEPALLPFATGSAVIAQSERLSHIEAQHRQVGGIDMEAFGMYLAAHELADPLVHFFAAKSVVDHADKDKGDDFHAYGSYVSARFIVRVLQTILAPISAS